jgi:hypothetical protein
VTGTVCGNDVSGALAIVAKFLSDTRMEVCRAVKIKIVVFWVMIPCSFVAYENLVCDNLFSNTDQEAKYLCLRSIGKHFECTARFTCRIISNKTVGFENLVGFT